jgi:hypothetical protein
MPGTARYNFSSTKIRFRSKPFLVPVKIPEGKVFGSDLTDAAGNPITDNSQP